MRLIFLGTPAFAVPTLERLAERGHQVLAAVSQPDRPKGRGQALAAPAVKEAALRLGVPVYQPERLKRPDTVEYLRALAPDAMVVVAYGKVIPQSIIDIPPLGILNVHASLLPKYRGAGPVQWAIVNGEAVTGITIMQIDAGLDTGPMLLRTETAIGAEETAPELGRRLSWMGADLLAEALDGLAAGRIVPQPQDHSRATYAPPLKKEDGRIDWSRSAVQIHNQVRGMQPWPGADSSFRGATLHVWRARPAAGAAGRAPGSVMRVKPLLVACGEGSLELLEVQMEGRKRMPAADFVNGHRLAENEVIGEVSG